MDLIQEIHQEALRRAKHFKTSETSLLEIITRVLENNVHFALSYPSLHVYCTLALELTDAKAYELSKIAEKSRVIPELKSLIESEELSISNARQIVPLLTPENKTDWLSKATDLSKRELEREIKKAHPEKIPQERFRPLTGTQSELKLVVDAAIEPELKRVCDLLSQKLKKPVSLSEAVQYMTKGFLKQNDPVLKAERNFAPGKKSKPPVEGKRIVRAQTKHEVNLRDQGQCTHHYPDGKRCQSRRWTDRHHVIELAHGGSNTADNLSTLCSSHHRLLHERAIVRKSVLT
jgi:hypothetical protein